jgi:hypothetical protein
LAIEDPLVVRQQRIEFHGIDGHNPAVEGRYQKHIDQLHDLVA